MTGFYDLEWQMPPNRWRVPGEVEVRGDLLLWKYGSAAARSPTSSARPNLYLLNEFVRFADADDEAIGRFAKQWGVLYLCEAHDLPSSHDHYEPPPVDPAIWDKGPAERKKIVNQLMKEQEAELLRRGMFKRCPLRMVGGSYAEKLSSWRRLSRQTKAALAISGEVASRNRGASADWRTLRGIDEQPETLPLARMLLSAFLNDWTRIAGVGPVVEWGTKGPDVTFGNRTLFGAIAMQMVLFVVKRSGIAVCSHCGAPCEPRRMAEAQRRRFCPTCRKEGVPGMYAARDHRRRVATSLEE